MENIFIASIDDLEKLRCLDNMCEYLVTLTTDLDFCELNYLNVFTPITIGTNLIFDGNQHTISHLYLPLHECDNVGLFNTSNDSVVVVKDLKFVNCIVAGHNNVGIIGGSFNGTISNCYFEGNNIVIGNNNVGFLIGSSKIMSYVIGTHTCGRLFANEVSDSLVGNGTANFTKNKDEIICYSMNEGQKVRKL